MKLSIETKNLELTESLSQLINKRMASLVKFLDISDVVVEIGKAGVRPKKGDVFFAAGIIRLPRKKLFAKAHGDNLIKAISAMRDELEREIRTYKAKFIDEPRRKSRKAKHSAV